MEAAEEEAEATLALIEERSEEKEATTPLVCFEGGR
mgnify:FL=1